MSLDIAWDAPAGFHLYRTDWDGPSWVTSVLAETATDVDDAEAVEAIRRSLEELVAEAHADEDDGFRLWVAGFTPDWRGRPLLTTVGSFTLGDVVDVDEVAQEWREAQEQSSALRAEVEVAASRRAPVVVAREVYLTSDDRGAQTYREWGMALRVYPRLGTSARLELDTSDLSAFGDLKEFLVDAVRGFHLTPLEALR